MSADRITAFLDLAGWAGARRRPLAGDASARRYERLARPGGTAILMDSPDPANDVVPFLKVAAILREIGLSVPAVLAADPGQGLLLLEDFGDSTFTRLMEAGEDPAALYRLATDALVRLHRFFDPAAAEDLPRYDADLFVGQVMLFAETYLPHALGREPTGAERSALEAAWRRVVRPACEAVPSSLLHRDWHVDNLMRLEGRQGAAACGILDFQQAGLGPVSYDLVSILEDARRDVPDAVRQAEIDHYLAAFPGLDRGRFLGSYGVMGAVRHTRILAVFARLWLRDGRAGYLQHMPRVWRLLEGQLARAELAPVRAWFDATLPPETRAPLFVSKSE
ncbi:aminoglycoside phosphotransferase family protein [Arenibaculum pallidiluteum]|uniref:aminoglycoside phosphotransferase family protein n=1 Tax=Arenibaculum pallidiluteum TaxID=2812559 RepID=UPI002E2B3110|nr:phosphotransferase [Arenibaculum pallidiluteum]